LGTAVPEEVAKIVDAALNDFKMQHATALATPACDEYLHLVGNLVVEIVIRRFDHVSLVVPRNGDSIETEFMQRTSDLRNPPQLHVIATKTPALCDWHHCDRKLRAVVYTRDMFSSDPFHSDAVDTVSEARNWWSTQRIVHAYNDLVRVQQSTNPKFMWTRTRVIARLYYNCRSLLRMYELQGKIHARTYRHVFEGTFALGTTKLKTELAKALSGASNGAVSEQSAVHFCNDMENVCMFIAADVENWLMIVPRQSEEFHEKNTTMALIEDHGAVGYNPLSFKMTHMSGFAPCCTSRVQHL
jgi:hypothetical protein